MGVSMSLSTEEKNRRYYENHPIPRKNIKKDRKFKYNQVHGIYYVKQKNQRTQPMMPRSYSIDERILHPHIKNKSKIRITSIDDYNKQNKEHPCEKRESQNCDYHGYNSNLNPALEFLFSRTDSFKSGESKVYEKQVQKMKEQRTEKMHRISQYFNKKDSIKQQYQDQINNQKQQNNRKSINTKKQYQEKIRKMVQDNKRKRTQSLNMLSKLGTKRNASKQDYKSPKPSIFKEQSKQLQKQIMNMNKTLQIKDPLQLQMLGNQINRSQSIQAQIFQEYYTKYEPVQQQENYRIISGEKHHAESTTYQFYSQSLEHSSKSGSKYVPPRKLIYF